MRHFEQSIRHVVYGQSRAQSQHIVNKKCYMLATCIAFEVVVQFTQ